VLGPFCEPHARDGRLEASLILPSTHSAVRSIGCWADVYASISSAVYAHLYCGFIPVRKVFRGLYVDWTLALLFAYCLHGAYVLNMSSESKALV
jgi:hypothetical protein